MVWNRNLTPTTFCSARAPGPSPFASSSKPSTSHIDAATLHTNAAAADIGLHDGLGGGMNRIAPNLHANAATLHAKGSAVENLVVLTQRHRPPSLACIDDKQLSQQPFPFRMRDPTERRDRADAARSGPS